jgi:quinolinate synthase
MNSADRAIEAIHQQMGARLFIPAHYYQDASVLRHADAAGDSLELSRKTAARRDAEKIVFCGVRFMAETADILKAPGQAVYLPDPGAGCPMADMATDLQAEACASRLSQVWKDWIPIVYVNSSAALKAFCGRREGSACTSSNAVRVFKWALDAGKRILFLPDQHLGANSAHDLGLPDEQVQVYDPTLAHGGLTDYAIGKSQILVWKGFCHVHSAFQSDHVHQIRAAHPKAKIIVHPEACKEVVRLCDFHGSTTQLIDYVRQAPDGEEIFIGTEQNLVARLANEENGRVRLKPLRVSLCPDMGMTTPEAILKVLQEWPEENRVHVPPSVAAEARLCLDRMLAL